jgi:sodium-coupled neutral amino acid transporter 11
MCAFCTIIGDTIPHVLVAILPNNPGSFVSFLISRPFVITFCTIGVSYPLSLYRDIEKLSKASAMALVR